MRAAMILPRALATLIAIAAVIDPAVTSMRRTKPQISLLAPDANAGDAAQKVLAKRYTVIRGPYANAAATVLVGNSLSDGFDELASPLFVVPGSPAVVITNISAPRSASVESRVPVVVEVRPSGLAGQTIHVALSMGGIIVDRATREVGGDSQVTVPLSFIPTTIGSAHLETTVRIEGRPDSAVADLAVDVHADRWSVLFFDRRPSWMSTFVRRSLEADRRFVVASRVITSRGISTDAGRPPSSLEDPTLLELYDAIVVGAPEAMSARDAAGLEAFMRRRGGGVVLMFDERPKGGGPYDRLTNVARWGGATSGVPSAVTPVSSDSGGLRATELMWPESLPAGGQSGATALAAERPVVWSAPIGSGRLIVNGALDSWKFRDATTSAFDSFWRTTISAVVSEAMPAVQVRVANTVVAPGEMIEVTIGVRDALLAGSDQAARASVRVQLDSAVVRMWPGKRVGELVGRVRAPTAAGKYRIVASANGGRDEVPLVVAAGTRRAERDDREIVAAVAGSRGGKVVAVGELSEALAASVTALPRMERWYPMRWAGWIVLFVGLVGLEWLWRRRQGLR